MFLPKICTPLSKLWSKTFFLELYQNREQKTPSLLSERPARNKPCLRSILSPEKYVSNGQTRRNSGVTLPPLGFSDSQSDGKRISLRDRDRLRNNPQWVPGFLSCCSWMLPERLRNKSELVGSEENRYVLTEHPRYETLSYWILLRIF